MKKQLLIAALASSLIPGYALADVSISGTGKVNFTNVKDEREETLNSLNSHEIDFNITATNGDTTVYANLENVAGGGGLYVNVPHTATSGTATVASAKVDNTDNRNLRVKDIYLTSKIGSAHVKAGTWFSSSDTILDGDGTRKSGKFQISTNLGPVNVGYHNENGKDVDGSGDRDPDDTTGALSQPWSSVWVSYSHDLGSLYYERGTSKWTHIKLDVNVEPIKFTYSQVDTGKDNKQDDLVSMRLSGTLKGYTVTFIQGEKKEATDASHDDYFGYITNFHKIQGLGVSMPYSDNTIGIQMFNTHLDTAKTLKDKYIRLTASRELDSGVTLNASYLNKKGAFTEANANVLDLGLSVSF